METLSSSASMSFPREPANYDEIAMHQSLLFSDSLKDLKNLRKQLYSAAEFFELSYTNDDQKEIVVDTLKDYAIKALVNTVDHLGTVSYKVNNLLDEKVEEVSGTELRVSCIQQRLRTCHEYFDHEGISQQSLRINIPNYFKRYVLPVGEMKQDGTETKLKHQGCLVDDEDGRHEHKNVVEATIREKRKTLVRKGRSPSPSPSPREPELFSFAGTVTRKDIEKRSVSPRRFPLLRTGSFSGRSTTPNSRTNSRSTTPNPSRPTTPTSIAPQGPLEGRKSVSTRRNGDRDTADEIPSKSKRLLKALLSRRKSRKDDMLYTYLDEY